MIGNRRRKLTYWEQQANQEFQGGMLHDTRYPHYSSYRQTNGYVAVGVHVPSAADREETDTELLLSKGNVVTTGPTELDRPLHAQDIQRRVQLPIDIYGLVIAAVLEPAFGLLHQSAIIALLFLNFGIQAVLIVSIYFVNKSAIDQYGCDCTSGLQWVGVFVFVLMIWEEISGTFETLELLAGIPSGDPSALHSARELSGRATPQRANSLESIASVSENGWCMCHGAEVVSSGSNNNDWCLCSMSFCSDEVQIYQMQFSGYRLNWMGLRCKILLAICVVFPKLVLEVMLLLAGSSYIMLSSSDEALITSMVSVNFIVAVDEMILSSLLPARAVRALRCTPHVKYLPQRCFMRVWAHIRTDLRTFVDPFFLMIITHAIFRYLRTAAGCADTLWGLLE